MHLSSKQGVEVGGREHLINAGLLAPRAGNHRVPVFPLRVRKTRTRLQMRIESLPDVSTHSNTPLDSIKPLYACDNHSVKLHTEAELALDHTTVCVYAEDQQCNCRSRYCMKGSKSTGETETALRGDSTATVKGERTVRWRGIVPSMNNVKVWVRSPATVLQFPRDRLRYRSTSRIFAM